MPAAAAAHATPKDLKGHGNRNSTLVSLNSWGVSRQLWQFQQPQHGTAAWASWLHSCCGTLPSQASLAPHLHRRHLPVPPSTTRGDRCPVQHGTVRPNLSLQQLAAAGQTWRALRLLPSSNTCTIWSLPWLLGSPRSSIPVGIVEKGSSRLVLAPRSRASRLTDDLVPWYPDSTVSRDETPSDGTNMVSPIGRIFVPSRKARLAAMW